MTEWRCNTRTAGSASLAGCPRMRNGQRAPVLILRPFWWWTTRAERSLTWHRHITPAPMWQSVASSSSPRWRLTSGPLGQQASSPAFRSLSRVGFGMIAVGTLFQDRRSPEPAIVSSIVQAIDRVLRRGDQRSLIDAVDAQVEPQRNPGASDSEEI